MKSKFVKALTLTTFIALIIAFVAYRSGFFGEDRSSHKINSDQTTAKTSSDSLSKTDSLKKIQMLPSSKLLILKDPTIKLEDLSEEEFDSVLEMQQLIYSSKSAIIIEPEDVKKSIMDSVKNDSTQNK